jgi:hypothetical protein
MGSEVTSHHKLVVELMTNDYKLQYAKHYRSVVGETYAKRKEKRTSDLEGFEQHPIGYWSKRYPFKLGRLKST